MAHRFPQERPASRMTPRWLAIALLLGAPTAAAQTNLGELLDAGAVQLSAEEFKQDVVGRIILGPTANGGSVELLYSASGAVAGTGSLVRATFVLAPISGEWKTDANGKICTAMTISGQPAGPAFVNQVMLPFRCQTWFKLGAGQYFLSDSDSDRSAKVLRRTLKQ
jgi:hypothetical protein